MSQEEMRQRVTQAAEDIIRADGTERLTMRRLAEEAQVALKTPYNLFGSKTGVMIALLDQAILPLVASLDQGDDGAVILGLMEILEATKTVFGADEEFLRGVFWGVMTSDHPEARSAAHERITALVVARVTMAKAAGEVAQNIDPAMLGGQLGLNLLANMGSWAGGHLSIGQAMDHTKAVWSSLLLHVVSPPFIDAITQGFEAVQGVISSPTDHQS